jgi:hypothetical protein
VGEEKEAILVRLEREGEKREYRDNENLFFKSLKKTHIYCYMRMR